MAYSNSGLRLILDGGIGGSPSLWLYTSADAQGTVNNSGYIADGTSFGMADGDLIFVYNSGSKIWTSHTVLVSGSTVNLSNGTPIGVSADTG